MTAPSFELISFRLCPFVQRAVILLSYKAIDHKLTFIDLSDPPDWFRNVSPQGKVPVLRIDHEFSIFESAVISEYLDEVTMPRLMPADPLVRAINRSWIEYAATALMPLRDLTTVETAEELGVVRDGFRMKLDPLEHALGEGRFFNGSQPSLVDFAYAPMFARLNYFATYLSDMVPVERFPKIAALHGALTDLDAVKRSVGEEFLSRMDELVARRRGYLASLLPDELQTAEPRRDYWARPELAQLSDDDIHAPFETSRGALRQAGVELSVTYLRPIVDHRSAREQALAGYEVVKAAAR